jgi:thiamine biosynthesis lipoprotein
VSPKPTFAPEHERRFELFGSEVRLLIGPPRREGIRPPALAALELEAFLRNFHRRLTRFDSASDLCALNACKSESCQVPALLALAARGATWAAEYSRGLVDPTLVDEIERVGYARSRVGLEPASLERALASAPARRRARPHPLARWQQVSVDEMRLVITRPPGVRLDLGGVGKGLAADLCATRLAEYDLFVVDAGGDLRMGGQLAAPRTVEIESPLTGESALTFKFARGAVATSGISTRIWERGDAFAHHLLDPATGDPAWTGVVQATAIAETALEAETLAKMALMSGPEEGASLLAANGGLLVLDNGSVVRAGRLGAHTPTAVPA